MKITLYGKTGLVWIAWIILLITGSTATGQEILLDKMEKCGDLICYPGMEDENQFYYLPDQPRLAYKDGKPQFSFLKYARTQETGEAGIGRAQGGGIIHFLVTYGVSPDRVRKAEKHLKERHPDAHINGPIVYRKGNFALITSFKEGNEITTRTVAVGKAPLMEGQKAAVSMALTREGAELLWESFKTDTPDISLVFDMEFAGIRQPYEATLEADWSNVSKHDRIKAGIKYKWFGADVDILFQELRQTGAIKITTRGDNTLMDGILQSANEKLLKVMFDPVPADDLTRAAAEKGYDSLDRAAKLLKEAASSGGGSSRSGSGGSRTGSSGSGTSSSGGRSSGSPRFLSGLNDDSAKKLPWATLFNCVFPMAYGDSPDPVEEATSLVSGSEEQSDNDPRLERSRERFYEGLALFEGGKYQQAIQAFEASEEMYQQITGNPTPNGAVPNNIGRCYLFLGNYGLAETYFSDAVNRYPEGSEQREVAQRGWEDARHMIAQTDRDGELELDTSMTIEQSQPLEEDSAVSASDAYTRARRLYEEARRLNFQATATQAALGAYESYQRDHSPTGSRAEEVNGRIRMLRERLGSSGASASSASRPDPLPSALPNPGEENVTAPSSSSETAASDTPSSSASGIPGSRTGAGSASSSSGSSAATSQPASGSRASSGSPARQTTAARQTRANGSPGFSLVASYQMKRIKRSGKMVYNMNHFRTETQAFAMAENIGSIYKRYGNDSRVFQAVTIDDPVFKQREIMVTLDGQDAATFTKYLNFVTVKMKKNHQAGEVTTGEIVITPETFNLNGNHFSMTYGWKNDADRAAWLNYEYQTIWSFHGGVEIRSPWTRTDSPILALTPPHRYRSVSIEGDGDTLTDADVRHGVVTFSCRIGDRYIPQQVTIRNNSTAPSMMLDIPEDPDNPETRVSITWYLTKSRKLSSARTKLEGDIIYWDELPKGGI